MGRKKVEFSGATSEGQDPFVDEDRQRIRDLGKRMDSYNSKRSVLSLKIKNCIGTLAGLSDGETNEASLRIREGHDGYVEEYHELKSALIEDIISTREVVNDSEDSLLEGLYNRLVKMNFAYEEFENLLI